jgi:hypothetical protein
MILLAWFRQRWAWVVGSVVLALPFLAWLLKKPEKKSIVAPEPSPIQIGSDRFGAGAEQALEATHTQEVAVVTAVATEATEQQVATLTQVTDAVKDNAQAVNQLLLETGRSIRR